MKRFLVTLTAITLGVVLFLSTTFAAGGSTLQSAYFTTVPSRPVVNRQFTLVGTLNFEKYNDLGTNIIGLRFDGYSGSALLKCKQNVCSFSKQLRVAVPGEKTLELYYQTNGSGDGGIDIPLVYYDGMPVTYTFSVSR